MDGWNKWIKMVEVSDFRRSLDLPAPNFDVYSGKFRFGVVEDEFSLQNMTSFSGACCLFQGGYKWLQNSSMRYVDTKKTLMDGMSSR